MDSQQREEETVWGRTGGPAEISGTLLRQWIIYFRKLIKNKAAEAGVLCLLPTWV